LLASVADRCVRFLAIAARCLSHPRRGIARVWPLPVTAVTVTEVEIEPVARTGIIVARSAVAIRIPVAIRIRGIDRLVVDRRWRWRRIVSAATSDEARRHPATRSHRVDQAPATGAAIDRD